MVLPNKESIYFFTLGKGGEDTPALPVLKFIFLSFFTIQGGSSTSSFDCDWVGKKTWGCVTGATRTQEPGPHRPGCHRFWVGGAACSGPWRNQLDEISEYGITWAVMADPDGNEFCLVQHS
jgi:hypothetical protein